MCPELTCSTWGEISLRVWGSTYSRVGSLEVKQLVVVRSIFNTLVVVRSVFNALILLEYTCDITPLGLPIFFWVWYDSVSFSIMEVIGDLGRYSFVYSLGKRYIGVWG